MPVKLTDDIKQNVIDAKNVAWVSSIEIRDFQGTLVQEEFFKKYLTNYSFNLNRSFSSSTARLRISNPDGRFSPDNESAIIKKGFTITIKEYYQNYPGTKFDRFHGIIRQINPVKTPKGNEVEVFCYDKLIKLQDTDIEKVFESQKFVADNEILTPNPLPDPIPFLAQVFDGNFSSWAYNPAPILQIRDINSGEIKTSLIEGFEIHYRSGQVVLNTTVNIEEVEIKATYYYYKTGLWGEDILEGILLEPDEFGQQLFTASDLTTTLNDEENVSIDTLHPITFPLNMTAVIDKRALSTDTEIFILRRDSWKFIASHSAKLGDDTITWTGKTDTTVAGIELTKLTGVSGITKDHSRGTLLSVFYDVDSGKTRAWRTTYNNISEQVSSSDFSIPGASYESFDKRFGILLLDSTIQFDAVVTLNKNYVFKTLQATGIEVPYLRVSRQKYQNRFDVIKNEVLKLLPPNYVILSRGTPKIWGLYMNQRPEGYEDYELKLNTRIQYVADQQIYTRTVLFGKNRNPHNIMLDETTKVLGLNELGVTFTGIAVNQELFLSNPQDYRPRSDYLGMTPFTDLRGRYHTPDAFIYPSWREGDQTFTPVVKIDGVSIGSKSIRVFQRHVCVDGRKVIMDHNTILPPDGTLERAIIPFDANGRPLGEWLADNVFTYLAQDVHPGDTVVYITHQWFGDHFNKAYIGTDEFQYTQKYGDRFEGVTGIDEFHPAGEKLTFFHPLLLPFADVTNEDANSFTVFDRKGSNRGHMYRDGDRTVWHVNWAEWVANLIKTMSYSVLTSVSIKNNKPAFYVSGHKIYVNRDLLQTKVVHKDEIVNIIENPNTHYAWDERLQVQNKVTATFKHRTILGRLDNTHNLKDGNPRTESQLAWVRSVPLKGQKIFLIDFGSTKKIQAVDIVAGRYYPHKTIDSQMAVDCNFNLTMQASNSTGVATLVSNALKPETNQILSEVVSVKGGQLKDFPDSGTAYIGHDAFQYTGIQRNVIRTIYVGKSRNRPLYRHIVDQFTGVTGLSEDHRVEVGDYLLVLSEPFSDVSAETNNFSLKSGESVSFEKDQLGEEFETRLLSFVVENVESVEIARGTPAFPISIASLNIFEDIQFQAEAKLSPTTTLTTGVLVSDTTMQVKSTNGFPSSGTGHLGLDQFSYTGKTSDSFTGVSSLSQAHVGGSFVTQENVWDEQGKFLADPRNLLSEVGDKVHKDRQVAKDVTDEKSLNIRAKKTLAEVYKDHNKVRISNIFAPYTYIGQTLKLRDPYSNDFEVNRNYFIESISSNNGKYELEVAFYP